MAQDLSVIKIQAYDFEIEYVKDKNNVVGNSLSRMPCTISLMEVTSDWKSFLLVYSKIKFSCKILDAIIQDHRYHAIYDNIYYKDQIYLIPESQLKEKIMQEAHNLPLAWHHGYLMIYSQIQVRFTWKGLKIDVLSFMVE